MLDQSRRRTGEFVRLDWIGNGEIWVALLTLTALEIVLGIDNIIFISILAGKLPPEQQRAGPHARVWPPR